MMKAHNKVGGFALVLVLGLIALATAILIAVVAIGRGEVRAQERLEQASLARRNALFALRIAIGRLQQHVADEGGITLRADYTGSTVFAPSWTGVVSPGNEVPLWLVNGPEHGLVVHPNNTVLSPSSRDASSVAVLKRALVSGERVVLLKSEIREYAPAIRETAMTGRYAYWVSDESLKVSLGVRTDLPARAGQSRYPYPRIGTIFPVFGDMSKTDMQRSRLVMTDQLLLVRPDDAQSGTGAAAINADTLSSRWPHVTANSISIRSVGEAIHGAFNVNSRSELAWRAVLGAVDLSSDPQRIIDAINEAERPFRTVADFEAKVTLKLGIGGEEEIAGVIETLAPVLQIRGDTFLIRAYGETVQPLGEEATPVVSSTAYCEALVQRKLSASPAYPNGRFEIVYLRWLSPDEV